MDTNKFQASDAPKQRISAEELRAPDRQVQPATRDYRFFHCSGMGRGAAVGRDLGVGIGLGVAVGVALGVRVAVGVTVGVGVGVGDD